MSLGTLFVNGKLRTLAPLVVAQYYNIDVKIADGSDPEYQKKFPLKKFPAFIGADGLELHETLAVTVYLLQLTDDKSHWLGKSKEDFASILKWLSFANADALANIGNAFRQLTGVDPYNKESVDKSIEYLKQVSGVFEDRLANHEFLVGDSLTIADIFAASLLVVGFKEFFDPQWRNNYPGFSKWYLSVYDVDVVKQVFPPLTLAETRRANVAPASK